MPRSIQRRTVAGMFAVVLVAVVGVTGSPSTTIATVESVAADPVAFGLVVAGLYLVRPLLAWPTTPLAAIVGYGYGVVGVPVALAGVVVTVVPVYVAARWFAAGSTDPAAAVPFVPSDAFERASSAGNTYYETAGPVRGVIVSRLAPIPSDVATCAAAFCGVSLRHLAVGTAIGELPWTVAAVVVGASTATVTTDGLGELGPMLAVGCAIAAVVLLAGPAYRYRAAAGRSGESNPG